MSVNGSECAASSFILGDVLVGNKLQVQFSPGGNEGSSDGSALSGSLCS